MLLELKVTNFAIIDNLHIQFRGGLNILSGETGAGKSILLKSLALLMGEKSLQDSIRTGADKAVIEGSFDLTKRADIRERLTEMGIEVTDDLLVVRRIVSSGNKGRIYLNGSLATLAGLRDVVSPLVEVTGQAVPLIEMTGQHDNRHLLSRGYHLDVVDQFTGVWKLRADFSAKFQARAELLREIQTLRESDRQSAQRIDFLAFQRDEIQALGLKPGEELDLESETRRLKHSARLQAFVESSEAVLYGDDDSITSRLHSLLAKAADLRTIDPDLVAKLEPLNQAKTLVSEVSYDLRDYAKNLDADPSQLEDLQARLSQLRGLQKKYGASVADILQALSEIESELHQLENADEILAAREAQLTALDRELLVIAKDMHKRRENGAVLLERGVNDELKDLNMKGLEFRVQISWGQEITSTGHTEVEFMTQTSKSDAMRPLAKFASGGELSRILLSIKQVVGASQNPRTYLFDEVDTGVSGNTAEKVGRKLGLIAKGQQVICVTHLPQVAAFGDAHFVIQKSQVKDAVNMEVLELKGKSRVQEIARLISGETISKTSLAHAEQLIKEASL